MGGGTWENLPWCRGGAKAGVCGALVTRYEKNGTPSAVSFRSPIRVELVSGAGTSVNSGGALKMKYLSCPSTVNGG